MNSFRQDNLSKTSPQDRLNLKFSSEVRQNQRQRIFNSERKKHVEEMQEEIYYKQYDELFMEELRV